MIAEQNNKHLSNKSLAVMFFMLSEKKKACIPTQHKIHSRFLLTVFIFGVSIIQIALCRLNSVITVNIDLLLKEMTGFFFNVLNLKYSSTRPNTSLCRSYSGVSV